MKLAEHSNKLQTNVHGETQNFGIGDASIVIEILRNRLYQNKVQTICQEYISNSRDSHREIGNKNNNFEVTVPTHLNPVFKVRDFGLGITPERMKEVFILYGASTKRNDNNQIGGFGIGAKSGFAYSDSFSIVTRVDGTKRCYVAHVGTNNNGRLDLVSTEKTKEENGTEIQIAVKNGDIEEFRNAIRRAVYFWKEKPILKGEVESLTLVHGTKVGSIEIINSELLPRFTGENYDSKPLIIIDGIPYGVSDKLLDKCKTLKKLSELIRKKIIFRIGNGVVEVAASRESIADSPKSIDAIEKMAQKAGLEVKTHISTTFGAVTSPGEYIKAYKELNGMFRVETGYAQYNGYNINNDSLISDSLQKINMTEINCLGRWGRERVNKITRKELLLDRRKIDLNLFDHIFFYKGGDSNIVANKRIRHYFETNTRMLLIEVDNTVDKTGQPLHSIADLNKVINDLGVKDFQSIVYPILPKEERVKISREKTEFCMHVLDGSRYKYTTLSDNGVKKWFYVPVTDAGWGLNLEELKTLHFYLRDTHGIDICGLADRALKMVKGDVNFSPLQDWLDSYKPSKKEIAFAKSKFVKNNSYMPSLQVMKGVKDKELTALVEEYKQIEKSGICTMPEILLKKINQEKEVKDFKEQDEEVFKLVKREYPLLEYLSSYTPSKQSQEMTWYLNAKFENKS